MCIRDRLKTYRSSKSHATSSQFDDCFEDVTKDNGLNDIPLVQNEEISVINPYLTNLSVYKHTTESNQRKPLMNRRHKSIAGISESKNEVKLVEWIKQLGVKVKVPLCSSFFEQFRDGVLLVRIVEKLERKAIRGICEHPKSPANSLHNIRKALEMLKLKKNIPVEYLHSEGEILKGNKSVVIGLLNSIKLAYPLARVNTKQAI
eukprot:TRINITY_DN14851_c0_g1_i17.p1 TRINITY_DN14851_c0_g1~~TRINITY_DN14851_c0_g1_i17.p1  ORF type:complete len:204 (-),score=18.72 TRINITY_DN14851_c0_g1_i17:193-804(-)